MNISDPAPQNRRRWLPSLDRVTVRTATLLALLAVVLAGGQWIFSRAEIAGLKRTLSQRLGEADNLVRQNQAASQMAQEGTREVEARVSALEGKFAESQNQQVMLEAMYQELSRNRDDWILAEVEQLVVIANQQLQLTGNVQSALSALQAADLRLQKTDKPVMQGLRKVLNQDIDRLRALPFVDTTGISIRLDNVTASVDSLPLASDTRPAREPPSTAPAPASAVSRMTHELLMELSKAVQIRRMDTPELPLLSPDQAFFLRENLKLRLMSARLGALSRNETSYRADLKTAIDWLNHYFDRSAKPVQVALDTLKQLADTPVSIALPDVNDTLRAVRAARVPREPARR
jgi:uroporphyrin-3 C-methyltransferase